MFNFRRSLPRSTRQKPKIEVIKEAEYTPADEEHKRAAVGETVKYDIVATNTGNVDITGATITDTLLDLSEGT